MSELSRSETTGYVAPSVIALRNHGPLTLREITRWTAIYTGTTQLYKDVDAVLLREEEAGRVMTVESPGDFRERVWRAV
jgi:hypothetical protein